VAWKALVRSGRRRVDVVAIGEITGVNTAAVQPVASTLNTLIITGTPAAI